MKYIIISGSPTQGFTYTGLFNNALEAVTWADNHLDARDWWLSEIHITKEV